MALQLPESEVDNRDETIESLRKEVRRLEQEVRQARLETVQATNASEQASTAIRALRLQLGPLHRAMRAVFGEIELAVGEYDPQPQNGAAAPLASVDGRVHGLDKWEGVKKRLGGKEAELIDVLLTSGPRTNTQLKSLLKLAYSTVCALTQKMANMGFIAKQGDAYALKE